MPNPLINPDHQPEDPFDTPQWWAYAEHFRTHIVPMIDSSAVTMHLHSSADLDVRQAAELGAMILMDKPILVMVVPGTPVNEHLARVADEIIEMPTNDTDGIARLQAAMDRVRGTAQ